MYTRTQCPCTNTAHRRKTHLTIIVVVYLLSTSVFVNGFSIWKSQAAHIDWRLIVFVHLTSDSKSNIKRIIKEMLYCGIQLKWRIQCRENSIRWILLIEKMLKIIVRVFFFVRCDNKQLLFAYSTAHCLFKSNCVHIE